VAAARVRGLVKRFDEIVALDGVDLVVDEGEVRGLLGPNGAGKTTLLRIMFGLVRPDAGSVELFGRRLDPADPRTLEGVSGFVEDPTFYPYLSGRANLELLAELDGGDSSRRVDAVLDQVGLARRARDRVNGYSTGMKQRLGIAAALLRGPRLLLLDEPTAGLDPAGVRDIGRLVRDLSADRVAILVSSHQIVEVEDVCDTFTVLRRGRVVWSGSAAELGDQAPGSSYRLLTSDDARALELAQRCAGVAAVPTPRGGLEVSANQRSLDAFVLALGSQGVAVRLLELLVSPVESMFFALTGERAGEIGETSDTAPPRKALADR
jgi:ABC-2 type transport system ATP-binding protein